MFMDDVLKQGGDLIRFLRTKTPQEGQQMVVAIYAEGAAAMEAALKKSEQMHVMTKASKEA